MRAKRSSGFQYKAVWALPLAAAVLGPAACASATGEEVAVNDEAVSVTERYLSPWNDADRKTWYTTPQGSHLIDYGVFRALEVADGNQSFSARKNLEPLGFVYPPKDGDAPTFEGLPLGVLKDTSTFDQKDYLGLTCAACHTGQVNYRGKRILVEAGQGSLNFEGFFTAIKGAIDATEVDDKKMRRFCKTLGDSTNCKTRLDGAKAKIDGIQARNVVGAVSGPGRLDAIGIILNELLGNELAHDATSLLKAPVSYPPVWDAPRNSCVQTNCIGRDPMTRNIGEVLGVFAHAKLAPTASGPAMLTTAKVDNLYKLESALGTLGSPKWDAKLFGGVNATKAAAGEALYTANCASCHTRPDHYDANALAADPAQAATLAANFVAETVGGTTRYLAKVVTIPYQTVGTDPTFMEQHNSRYSTDPSMVGLFDFALRAGVMQNLNDNNWFGMPHTQEVADQVFAQQKAAQVVSGIRNANGGVAQLAVLGAVVGAALQTSVAQISAADPTVDSKALYGKYTNYRAPGSLVITNYRARPLDGVAFTAPYGHNGSWPTLRDVLTAPAQRHVTFPVTTGSFDPVDVGVDVSAHCDPDTFIFDTRLQGNGNGGHTYGTELTAPEKDALIEYMKTL